MEKSTKELDRSHEDSLEVGSLHPTEGEVTHHIRAFQKVIYDYYENHGRIFPWRETDNPYHILVSEVMLQQTQTERVLQKYEAFIKRFPDFASLATASLQKVLEAWSGLGYNRRAINLKKTAEIVVEQFHAILPSNPTVLMTFPGIGRTTACAIAAFAFHEPVCFIETNIRTVFIHFFFQDKNTVTDSDIMPLVEKALDRSNPREWYYALMDYGVMLKKRYRNLNKKSAHYQRQSPFEGSNRQVRGRILEVLVKNQCIPVSELMRMLGLDCETVEKNLLNLEKEGFIKRKDDAITIG